MRLIGRRNFVRGFGLGAGAALLTPFARSLVAEAQGLEGSPRWILMHDDLGFGTNNLERWMPSAPDLTQEGALPPSFDPLAPWADRMMILDRFDNPFNVGQHGNGWASLSAVSSVASAPGEQQSQDAYPNPGGITIDVLAGQMLGAAPFARLGFGTDSDGYSSDAALDRVPDLRNARTAYDQILGGIDPEQNTAEIQAELGRRVSVLDRVGGDLQRMRSRLAGPERAKLDQLEGSLVSLEGELEALAEVGECSLPPYPGDDEVSAGKHASPLPPGFFPAMVSIATTALMCRLTNVIVLRPTPGRRNWSLITGNTLDKHDTSHGSGDDGDPSADQALIEIDRVNAGHLARMMESLQAVPEGGGSMLDGTLVTWLDQGGGKHHGGASKHPVITIGDPLGRLQPGRLMQFDPGAHKINDAFVTILRALGIETDTFGDPNACQGPLPGLG